MPIHIHTYIHTYNIHTYNIHTYNIHTYIRTYIHTYVHIYIHTYNIHTYISSLLHRCHCLHFHVGSESTAAAAAAEEEELGQHLPLSPHHIDADALAHILDLSDEEALLVLETLTSVLPDTPPFSEKGTPSSSSSVGKPAPVICLDDLILFLYIQGYKKPPIRPHKAAAASVAEVWPSTSAFDRLISTLSPLQVSHLDLLWGITTSIIE